MQNIHSESFYRRIFTRDTQKEDTYDRKIILRECRLHLYCTQQLDLYTYIKYIIEQITQVGHVNHVVSNLIYTHEHLKALSINFPRIETYTRNNIEVKQDF